MSVSTICDVCNKDKFEYWLNNEKQAKQMMKLTSRILEYLKERDKELKKYAKINRKEIR